VTFKGFYDEHLEFLGIERVHIVCTMNPATTVGRHPLSTRWVHVCVGGGGLVALKVSHVAGFRSRLRQSARCVWGGGTLGRPCFALCTIPSEMFWRMDKASCRASIEIPHFSFSHPLPVSL
jgi:hypothetical protein